ncbi:MAG: FKBP-type peptidyl-prolyl cis-trans isomerase [Bacteroidales bacterium]|nr:FKBP-type peptidyl-prolyl cis-trans isomerase [Bacteroidales bacterium]HOI31167.1 FKBP-type peptidyl-prolyl cis-trans isomerase [Bacteroidales bacterium]
MSAEEVRRSLEKANRYLVRTENEQINDYIKRHKLNVTETGSGLRYTVHHSGSGEPIKKGELVRLNFVMKFLTGDVVYTSKVKGVKTFVVGRGGVESGLEEAILFLRKGDKATIILPSHLAFGLLGDEEKVPPKTSLIYEIEVLD